jgi:hypothetical protein
MVELGWTGSEVTQENRQNMVSQGYIRAAELVTYRMPENPTSPVQARGCVVAYATFNEQVFGMPSHWFLRSVLQFYDLELHHLTP